MINVEIEFDPAKDIANVAKHGLSLRAGEGFDWETALEREDAVRAISLRAAEKHEVRFYYDQV